MRIGLFILTTILLALSSTLHAQRFQGAVMGGMNIAQVDGDEVFGFKRVGGHFGLAAILPINKWDITLETVFSQKGAREKPQYTYDKYVYDSASMSYDTLRYSGEYNLRLNYVEIPLMVHYTDRDWITAGAGFSYGRLVSLSEIEHSGNIPPYSDTVAFNKNDLNVLLDLQVRVWRQLKFNVRYAYSVLPIRTRTYHDVLYQLKDPWDRKQYNNLLTFRLVWVFNEQVPERRK
ncbi:MAG: outer membrane beta-barrel protein [Bacteroidales bacterium]